MSSKAMGLALGLLLLVQPMYAGQGPGNRALFDRGLTFDQFMGTVVAQRERWLKVASEAQSAMDDVDRLKRVGKRLQFLAIAEDWCPDSVNTLPYIALTARSAQVPLRIIDRVAGAALMRQHHSPDGRAVTPTIVFLREGRDVGAWVERPAPLQHLFRSMATDAEAAKAFANRQAWYDADHGRTTVAELVKLAEVTAKRR